VRAGSWGPMFRSVPAIRSGCPETPPRCPTVSRAGALSANIRGESMAQNNIVKYMKTTEDYENHIVKVTYEMVDGNASFLPVL
jgi:hypothetical protein